MPACSLSRTCACLLVGGIGVFATSAFAQKAPVQPNLIAAQADVLNGYPSDYVIVQTRSGIVPSQLPDGRWTFAPANGGGMGPDAQPIQVQQLANAMQARAVSAITAVFERPLANKTLAQQLGLDRYYLVHVPAGSPAPQIAAEFAAFDQLVERAMPDVIGGIATTPTDPDFTLQWNMNNSGQNGGTPDADVDAPECWNLNQGSSTTIVAVLDTGVQQAYTQSLPNPDPSTVEHPDLVGRVISGWDFNDGNGNTSDYHGHGTHCAGTIAATANNGVGIAGMNWNCKILAVKVVNDSGGGSATTLASAVTFATDNGANVLSMSLQYYGLAVGHPLEGAVAYAYDSGVLPVAATGNFASAGTISYPAKYAKCMGVGATNKFDALWSGSNTGPQIDVVAPGESVYSLWKLSGYDTMSGTSMATPHVSGLASLIHSYNPGLQPADIEAVIKNTAEDKGPVGFDNQYGWGRINAFAALQAAAPICPGNLNGDSMVNSADLLAVLNSWGPCGECAADIAPPGGNGIVNVGDLLVVINGWGPCP